MSQRRRKRNGSAASVIPRQRDDADAVIALESPFVYDIVGAEQDGFTWPDEAYPEHLLG
ncbi:hypothetical protein [Roseiflexus sp.]|uniref:hypothetical protein n=1 Tax=Roseiflexus sp. TaxID=2562120 RepID=UPI0021DE2630|nr:hypothetical protein [Roseiflexus sp.]GIV98598.1 MAG: hypothetical protein KatS3mg058_0002 [Roseiflexus sp.]